MGSALTQHSHGARSLVMKASNTRTIYGNPAGEHLDVLPRESPIPDHGDGRQTRCELEVSSRVLLRTSSEANVTTSELEVTQESARAVLHEDTDGRGRSSLVAHGHLKVNVLERSRLRDLPVNARRHVLLIVIPVGTVHGRQVKSEVADLPEELILVDVPVGAIAVGDVRITVDQGDAGEVGRALDCRPVGRMADEGSVVVSCPSLVSSRHAASNHSLDDGKAHEILSRLN